MKKPLMILIVLSLLVLTACSKTSGTPAAPANSGANAQDGSFPEYNDVFAKPSPEMDTVP